MPVGKNQKTAVVGQEFEPIELMAKMPTDPAIASGTFEGSGRKADQANPLTADTCRISQGFADFWQGAQVMMLLHQVLEALVFLPANQPHNDLLEIQHTAPLEQKMHDWGAI